MIHNTNIILNGLGINMKSSILDEFSEEFIPVPSDSSARDKLIKSNIITWGFDYRIKARFHQIEYMMQLNPNNKLMIDRSAIDQIIFWKMADDGFIDTIPLYNDDLNIVRDNLDKYLKYENTLGSHILIINECDELLHEVIDTPEFKNSSRATLYETVEQYYETQDRYVELYDQWIPNHNTIIIPSGLKFDERSKYLNYHLNKLIYE